VLTQQRGQQPFTALRTICGSGRSNTGRPCIAEALARLI
jgi:hypothetical protein